MGRVVAARPSGAGQPGRVGSQAEWAARLARAARATGAGRPGRASQDNRLGGNQDRLGAARATRAGQPVQLGRGSQCSWGGAACAAGSGQPGRPGRGGQCSWVGAARATGAGQPVQLGRGSQDDRGGAAPIVRQNPASFLFLTIYEPSFLYPERRALLF